MHFSLRGSPCQAEACLAERHLDRHSAMDEVPQDWLVKLLSNLTDQVPQDRLEELLSNLSWD